LLLSRYNFLIAAQGEPTHAASEAAQRTKVRLATVMSREYEFAGAHKKSHPKVA
jgi:hypothetical protein